MKMNFVWLALLVEIVAGCTSGRVYVSQTSYKQPVETTQKETFVASKNYELNKSKTTYVGQAMLRVEGYNLIDTINNTTNIVLTNDIPLKFDICITSIYNLIAYVPFSFNDNDYIVRNIVKISGNKYYAIPFLDKNENRKWNLLVNENGEYSEYLANNDLDWAYLIRGLSLTNPPKFKISQKIYEHTTQKISKEQTNYELIYNGRSKIAVYFLYREYTKEDIARASFFQNLTYDPDIKQIRFKNTIIEIDNANNESIKFKVLKDDLPNAAFNPLM